MKRYFILIVLFVNFITDVVSQSHVRLNNYWNNGFSINPAAVNDSYQNSITVATRKQWISFPGAPTDFYAAGTMYFEDYSMQLGAKVLTEIKGYTQSTEIQLAYAYALSLSEDLVLNMGIAGSYHNFAYDRSQITLASSEINSGIYENLLFKNSFDATLGFELAYNALKFGLSSANVFALFNKENNLNPNTNIAYLFYKQYSSNPVNFGVGLSGFTYAGISQLELNGTMFYRRDSESNELQIGLFYRTKFELGAIAGIDFGKLKVSYSFDYNLGQVLNQSYGTHEIMLTYNFKPSRVCKSCRWY
ncbi:MAG: PorP/SprF family type IX secretion system membrane protein [Paludibacter sp.]